MQDSQTTNRSKKLALLISLFASVFIARSSPPRYLRGLSWLYLGFPLGYPHPVYILRLSPELRDNLQIEVPGNRKHSDALYIAPPSKITRRSKKLAVLVSRSISGMGCTVLLHAGIVHYSSRSFFTFHVRLTNQYRWCIRQHPACLERASHWRPFETQGRSCAPTTIQFRAVSCSLFRPLLE